MNDANAGFRRVQAEHMHSLHRLLCTFPASPPAHPEGVGDAIRRNTEQVDALQTRLHTKVGRRVFGSLVWSTRLAILLLHACTCKVTSSLPNNCASSKDRQAHLVVLAGRVEHARVKLARDHQVCAGADGGVQAAELAGGQGA